MPLADASNFNCTNAANEFNTLCYATGTSTSDQLWRGYSFEVESPSQVSHLIGGATAGQFTVGLYRASPTNKMVPETLLGYLPFVGTGVQTSGAMLLPSGEVGTVTLQPNITYFIAQGRSSSSTTGVGLSVTGLNHVALEQSPLIKSGTWTLPNPSTHAYYWGNVGGERLILTYAATSTPVLPAIGVHYASHSNTIVSSGLIVHLDASNEYSYSTSAPTRWVNLVTFENAVLGGTIPPASTYNATVGSLNFTNQTFHMGKVLNNGSSFTYEAWVKPTIVHGTNVIFGSQGSPLYYHGSRLHGGVNGNQSIVQVNDLTPYAPVGKWQHLVMTFDHATKALYLNINGVRVVSVTGPSTLSYVSNNMYIGSHFGHSETLFSGEISQIRIYDRALTSEEALQNFSATSVPTGMAGSIALFSPTSTEGNFITLNPNGANQAAQTVSVRIGDTFTVTSPGFTRTGHSFNGFVDESGVSYQVGDTFIPTQRMILYAQWIPGTYNVSFDANLGTGEMTPQAIGFNQSAELSPNTFARTGYRFNRWATNPNNTGTFYNDNSPFTMNVEGQTLYAQWLANMYDVVYDGNLATGGSMAPTSIEFAKSLALRINAFTRTGYTFAGWNTQADGSGTSYANQASFPMTVTGQTLYAQWTPRTFTITFGQQSGSGGTGSVTATYDAPVPNGLTPPTRVGYSFVGYFQNTNGGGLQYYDATMTSLRNYEIAGATTLYAHWTPKFHNVIFNANQGSGVMEPQSILFATSSPLNSNLFTRVGYRFQQWSTHAQPNDFQTNYNDNQSFTMNASNIDRILYARWTANTYTLSYDANGGASNPAPKSVTFDANYSTLATATRTGYTFAGWFTEPTGGTQVLATTKMTTPDDHTIYAQWTPISYNITFNANAGTGTMSVQAILFDQTAPIKANTFTRVGYSFAGWNTLANGTGTSYNNEADFTMNVVGLTLFAQWTPNFYNVTFDPLLGSGVMAPQPILFGQSALLNPVEFTRTGYSFFRWNINTVNTSTFYADQQSFPMNTEGRVLYAHWLANSYNIVYDSNQGTGGSTANTPINFDATGSIRANGYTRTGYAFTGWNTQADGSGTSYSPGNAFLMNVLGLTLYAQWAPNTYNVTFNANAGTGTMTVQPIVFDESQALKPATFTRARYTFAGWNTLANGTGTHYDDQASFPMNVVGITLYAQWEPLPYNVTFNANLGSGVMNPQPIPFGLSRPLNSIEFTRTGYRFNRWTTISNNTGTAYADNAPLTMSTEGITLFANWIANSYDIVYDGNQATGGTMANTTVTFNSTATLRANTFTRIGYTFAGWNTQADGQGTAYVNANTLVPMNQLGFTLYAQWTPIPYNLTFNANGGTGTMANQSILFDSSGLVNPNTFTRGGFTFAGWNTLANGTGTAYAAGASYPMTTTGATLFAQWDRNSYTFTFDADGGTPVDSITIPFEGAVSVPSPTKEGYQFRRWSPALPSTMPAEHRSFKAEWIINTSLVSSGLLVNLDAGNPNSYSTANPTEWINLVTRENAVVGGSIPPAENYNASAGSLTFLNHTFHLGKVLNSGSGFTYEVWIKPTTTSEVNVILGSTNTVLYYNANRLHGGVSGNQTAVQLNDLTPYAPVGKWQHLVLSFNEVTKVFFLNINGVRVVDVTGSPSLSYVSHDMFIGTHFGSTNTFFKGDIAQVRIYGRSLTEEEALQNFYTTAIDAGVSGNISLYSPLTLINNIVTYEPNGAEVAAVTQEVQNGTNFTVASNFTRPGYTLTGFNRLANGTGTAYAVGDRITSTQNMTLHAQWAITQYAITYDANNGLLPADAVTSFTIEDEVTLPTPVREHFTFTGWATNEALTGNTIMQVPRGTSSSLSVYATYAEKPYSITYVANDADVTAPISQYSIGSGIITLPSNVQRTGYQFTGWVDEFGASISSFDASDAPEDRTFTAQFTPITYTITYQMNWGFNAPSNPTTFTIEDAIVFAPGSKSAYEFAGFYDNADLSGAPVTEIIAGTNQDITLYAKWTPIAIPGRFELKWEVFNATTTQWNGKRYPDNKDDFTNGFTFIANAVANGRTTIASSTNASTDTTRSLLNWFSIGDLRAVIGSSHPNENNFAVRLNGYFIPSQTGAYTFSITGDDATDLTLSGPGISGEWTIGRYGGNGMGVLGTATAGTGSIELVAGTIYQIMIRQQEHEGGEGLKVGWQHPGQTTTFFVYADELFSDSPSKITFEANTASGVMAPRLIVVGQPTQLSSNQFIKLGHTFTGWNTLPDGTGDDYENLEIITPTGDLTLYAQWEVVTFQLNFNVSGGSEIASINQPFNTAVATPSAPTRDGFTFTGWSPALPTTMPGVNTTHTAQWSANTYTINFDATGGTTNETNKSVTFGRAVGALPTAQRTGYTFQGWFNEATSGTLITTATTVSTPSNVTLFAQWTPINYSITFNTGGGSLIANQTLTIETDEFTLPIPTKLASVFTGWTTQSNRQGSGISMISSGTTASMTLYAMWEPQPFYANQPLLIVIPESLYESMGDETNLTFTAEGMPTGVEFDPQTKTFSGTPVSRNNLDEESFVVILTIAGNGLSEQYEIAIRVMYGARIFFITNGGAAMAPRDVARSTALEAPTPTKLGYTFVAWHETADLTLPFNWSSGVVQSETTLYAQWTPTIYTITIVDGGDGLNYPQTYTIESSVITLPTPSRVGLTFQSWSDEGRIPAGSTGNRTFTASWSPRNFTVTILADGRQVSRSTIPFGSSLASINLGTPPAKVGHTATGWDRSLPSTMPSENITVNAVYTVQSYSFRALDDQGNELASTNVNFNAAVPFPTPPTKEGFTFARWTPDTASMPAGPLTVTAVYEVTQYDVTFVDSDGTNLGTAKVAFGAPVTAIEPPEVEGKVFVEWTGLPASMPAEAVTVTAVYEDVEVAEDDEETDETEESDETEETEDDDVAEVLDETIPKLPRRSTTPIIIPDVILPDNPDPVVTRVSVNGVDMNVSIIPGQPVGVLPQATLGGYNFQGWMNAITGEMITPETVINNPDFVVLVPLFEKAPSLIDAARNVFQAIVANPFTKAIPANDLTTRTDNIQSSRVMPNELLESISIPGGLKLEVRANGSVVIPLPNETTPLEINVTGLDANTVQVYYTIGTEVPEHHDAQWKPYSGQPFLTNQPNQNVFLMVKDAYETNQVTFLRTATFVTNADKIPVSNFIQVSTNERLDSLANTKQHTFLTQVEYEDTMVDMFVIEPRNEDELMEVLVRYRANDHNKSLLLDVEAVTWFEEIILPGTSLGVYLRTGDNLDFTIEYRFLGRASVLESFQVSNAPTGLSILLPVQPNMFLRAILGLLIVSTIAAPYVIKPKE